MQTDLKKLKELSDLMISEEENHLIEQAIAEIEELRKENKKLLEYKWMYDELCK